MLGAVALAHVGRARIEAARESRERGARALFFFGASLLVILIAVPLYAWPL